MPDYLELLRQLAAVFNPREAEAKMRPMDDRASRMIKLQREAQAPAPGTPEAEAPLTGRWFSPERRAMYQDIGRATEAHPRTVEIYGPQGWPAKQESIAGQYHQLDDVIGIAPRQQEHFPAIEFQSKSIPDVKEAVFNQPVGSKAPGLVPMPEDALPIQDTLAHEQLHFLMYKLMQAEEAEGRARRAGKGLFAGRQDFQEGVGTGARQAYGGHDLQHQLIAYLLGRGNWDPIVRQDTYPEPMSGTHPPAASPEIADAYRRLIHQIFPDEARRTRALTGLGAPRGGTLLEELR